MRHTAVVCFVSVAELSDHLSYLPKACVIGNALKLPAIRKLITFQPQRKKTGSTTRSVIERVKQVVVLAPLQTHEKDGPMIFFEGSCVLGFQGYLH